MFRNLRSPSAEPLSFFHPPLVERLVKRPGTEGSDGSRSASLTATSCRGRARGKAGARRRHPQHRHRAPGPGRGPAACRPPPRLRGAACGRQGAAPRRERPGRAPRGPAEPPPPPPEPGSAPAPLPWGFPPGCGEAVSRSWVMMGVHYG